MKKIVLYTAVLLTAITTSCSRINLYETTPAEYTGIRLEPVCAELSTKATIPGDDAYNENVIDRFHYFIYSDAEGTVLLTKGISSEGSPVDLILDDYADSFTDNKGYVYVIANLPEDMELPASPTVAALQELSFTSAFYTGEARNGKVNPDNRFVMVSKSGPQEFSLTAKIPTEVKAELKRVAAKIAFTIDVVKQVQQEVTTPDGHSAYLKTWDAQIDQLQIYLLWAAKDGSINGVPLKYSEELKSSFYTTPRYAMFDSGDASGSVPSDAYKEIEKEFTLSEWNEETQKMEIVTEVRECYELTAVPLYSYPISWNINDAHAPFIKVILPWLGSRDGVGPDDKPTEFYYKIMLPEATELVSNTCYNVALDLAVLGSEADDVPVEVTGKYYAIDWNEAEEMGGDTHAGRYLKVKDTFEMYGDELEIPYSSSGPVVISAYGSSTGSPSASYPLGYSEGSGEIVYSTTSAEGTNFMVTPAADQKYVAIEHVIEPFSTSFSRDNGNAKDVAAITYKFRISLEDDPEYYQDVTVIQYPSIYMMRLESSGSPFVYNESNRNPVEDNRGNSLGRVQQNTDYGKYFTIVSISSLDGVKTTYPDWVIGDPRIRLGDVYIGQGDDAYYVDNHASLNWYRNALGGDEYGLPDYYDNYLVGNKDASNVIAPKFMLASGYGVNLAGGTWRTNAERCATYQEDGYPAGRWRMPTEAEILFCRRLGENGLITNPFASTMSYFATSGRYINSSGSFSNGTNQSNYSVRCVYDLWYWGDGPVEGVLGNYTFALPE